MTSVDAPRSSRLPEGFPALGDVLQDPGDLARLEQAWGRSALRFTLADRYRSLLTMPLVEQWLNVGNLRYPQFLVIMNGKNVPASEVTRERVAVGERLGGFADVARVGKQLERGATLQFGPIDEWHAPAALLCNRLALGLRALVHTVAFLTPPDEFGLGAHRDDTHVLVLQMAGSKIWSVDERSANDPPSKAPSLDGDGVRVHVLEAGDGLYLPERMVHGTKGGPKGSLHVTVSIREPSPRALINTWAAHAAARLTPDVRINGSRTDRVEKVRELCQTLGAQLASMDPERLLEAIERSWIEPDPAWVSLPGGVGPDERQD